ncbi:hypothetical protein J2T57_000897 [Natronocella acetinitrilica]|jgi:hypothetical protein|uniref:Uncharacterized protein n=1 Tax=Natronocella acetinitrilica TaxID=414046 RepID=A0AAE3G3P5_9GAMM|nr:hypothetical protein [Natronocella acetinitrilica]MCP1673798.1 hypothetical protein [Natronocella acetinitrilica]
MGDVVPFGRSKRRRKLAEGQTLCRNGFHKWEALGDTRFDTREGKLATVYRCKRCGAEQTRYT